MRWQVVTPTAYYLHESFGMGMQAMGERNVLDGIGDAIADIRSKLIDEGWFGRRGPSAPSASSLLGWDLDGPKPRTGEERTSLLSFEDAWATREPSDKLGPDYDFNKGIDR